MENQSKQLTSHLQALAKSSAKPNPKLLKALYEHTLREVARTDRGLGEFGEYVFGHPPARHHALWVRMLEEPSFNRQLVIAPPGHAKSTWFSIIYPVWKIGLAPQIHYLGTSITATQSQLFSVAVRDTISTNAKCSEVFPDCRPDRQKGWGQDEWFVERSDVGDPHPTYAASGVGGPVIGRRAHAIGLDDPYDEKNSATALQRQKVLVWLKRTLRSRLSPEGRFQGILTRWHYDDFVQEFRDRRSYTIMRMVALSPGAEQLADVCFREVDVAKAEEIFDDIITWVDKDKGEATLFIHDDGPALWPEFWEEAALVDQKSDMGTPLFNCMYQGDPSALAGNIFKLDNFRQLPSRLKLVAVKQFWDTALTKKDSASYTAGATCGVDADNNFFVLRMRRKRMSSGEHQEAMVAAWYEDREEWPFLDEVGVERGLASISIITDLAENSGLNISNHVPTVDKVLRARPVAAKGELGKLFVDKKAPWWNDFLDEFLSFDRGAFDDQVDAVSGCYEMLVSAKPKWKTIKFLHV